MAKSKIHNIFNFRISFRKYFPKFYSSRKMGNETFSIHESHEKITELILTSGEPKDDVVQSYFKHCKLPPVGDFKKGLEWFNVSEPLTFAKHLRGKVVVLDFFTYCCINCMHILPELKELEQKFSVTDGLVVVGVHSAKFDNEKLSPNILAAVQRYGIDHAVVNDNVSDMWGKCDVHCWPTVVLLGPQGNPLVMLTGEGHKTDLELYVRNALTHYKSTNEISSHALPQTKAAHLLPERKGPLLFPGKICAFIEDGLDRALLAISDSGNHRILITDEQGNILHSVGGKIGFKDGSFDQCQFNAPQGLVFHGRHVVYVADTENHAIRRVDLNAGTVATIAGTGKQGHDYAGGKVGKQQTISSPWDLVVYKHLDCDVLLIAMAGTHQMWALFLDKSHQWWKDKDIAAGTCRRVVGSGREENRNNQYPLSAAFAQPSGLALRSYNGDLFLCDSESSSIRRIDLTDGRVVGVVGGDRNPNNLFAFGDCDGKSFDAKLQHPLGVALSPGELTLFVADTYNHKIKRVDLETNTVYTMTFAEGMDKTLAKFNEPAGLTVIANKLYVADTNNHCIKVIKLSANYEVSDISLLELKYNAVQDTSCDDVDMGNIELHGNSCIDVKGGKIILHIEIKFESDLKLTEDAPQQWAVRLPNPTWSCTPPNGTSLDKLAVVVSVPPKGHTTECALDFQFNLVTCAKDVCYPKRFIARHKVCYDSLGDQSVNNLVTISLKPPSGKL